MSPDARRAARVSPPPIYLHFLDRELGNAFEFELTLKAATWALATLALGTMSPLICSLSALLENDGLRGGEGMVADLVGADALVPRSTHSTLGEFLDSRRAMYEHDRARYPRYFDLMQLGRLGGIQPRYAPGSTTSSLHARLERWTEGASPIAVASSLPADVREPMLREVASELGRRDGRAVTYTMFSGVGQHDPSQSVLERVIRQRISIEFTDHHRGDHGRLATGVGLSLEPLERVLQPDWPFEFDVPILSTLLAASGLGPLGEGWVRELWQAILALRGGPEHFGVVSRIQRISRALDDASNASGDLRAERRVRARTAIRISAPGESNVPPMDSSTLFFTAQASLDALVRGLERHGLGPALAMHDDVLVPLTADVLLIVATDVEERETLDEFGYPPGKSPRRHPLGQQIYLELGTFAGERVFLVRSEMGAGGSGGSQFTADDAIRDLAPSWVLMVGIAFGVDAAEQRIGDVLVADRIVLYDHQRVGTRGGGRHVVYRDPPGQPDAALLKRLRDGSRDFEGAEVRVGKLLSGSDLVDNEQHRDELVRHAADGDAIGGEMELAGLFAAAERRRGRWGAIKAICDFADGAKGVEKAARQRLAARNAARFARHMIERGLLSSPPESDR